MLSLQGDLEAHPFPRLMNYLHEGNQTGRLVLRHSGVSKTVFIVQGIVVNVESSLRDETLGRYLIKQGKITEDDYNKSIEIMMAQKIKQGAALVKIGAIKPKDLFQAVRDQTREKLLTCFSWIRGEYRYQEDISFVEETTRFELPFISIMREGLNRFFPEDALSSELSLVSDGPLIPEPDLLEQISAWELAPEEKALVFQIDGKKNLEELVGSAGKKEKGLFYLLLLIGMIKPGDEVAEDLREVIPGEIQEPLSSDEVFMPQTITIADEDEMEVEIEAAEDKKDEDDVLSEYIDLKSKDYFSLLGVGIDASDEEVDQAYREKMEEFSRDRFVARLSVEAETKLEEINARYILAYESLKNAGRREKYRQGLEEKPAEPAERPELEAEKYLQMGMQAVRTRDWANAQKMFEKAVDLRPDEPEYYGYLGWSIYSNDELEFDERRDLAIEKLGMALEMNPNMDSVHVFLGKIFKDEGNTNEAIAEFKLALQCNPNCREAARELKAHGVEV